MAIHLEFVHHLSCYNYCVFEHYPFFCFDLKQRPGVWILSPSSGKNILSWAQSIHIVLISGRFLPEDGDRMQSPKRCVLNKNRTIDNVQKHYNCINTPSLETFLSQFLV
jgi:hypothetical protein